MPANLSSPLAQIRAGKTYKTRGYKEALSDNVYGQCVIKVIDNDDGFSDNLPFTCLRKYGQHWCPTFTVDQLGRCYPPDRYPSAWGNESPYDLIEEVKE